MAGRLWWRALARRVAGGGRRSHTRRPARLPVRTLALAMMGLAVAVQVVVWGLAPGSGGQGALVPGLRPVFGLAYGALLLVGELGVCAFYRLRQGAVAVASTAAAVDVVFWIVRLTGHHFPLGDAAALTAGFGALALGAGLLSGRLDAPAGHDGASRRYPDGGPAS